MSNLNSSKMKKDSQKKIAFKNPVYDESPVSKLYFHDSSHLSQYELIMALTGINDTNVVDNLLEYCDNSLSVLSRMSCVRLSQVFGIGKSRAASIVAAFELGKRFASELAREKTSIKQSVDIFDYMRHIFTNLDHEEFWILYLNHGHKIIKPVRVSQGGISETSVDIRIILRNALELTSTSFVAIHNHPSGNLKPSTEDIKVTNKIKQAALLMDITLLDHIIVGDAGYYSFADDANL